MSAINHNIVQNGLVLNLDASNTKTYTLSGTTWKDLSSNKNNGTLFNNPIFSGNAINLNGNNNNTVSGSILMYNSFSVSFWIRPKQINDFAPAFTLDNSGWGNFEWHTTANGGIYCGTDVVTRFTPSTPNCTPNTIIINSLYNYTYTFTYVSGTTGIGRLYKNFDLIATGTHNKPTSGGTITKYLFFSVNTGIGNMGLYSFLHYNRPLSQTEIQQNYYATKSKFGL